MSEPVNEPIKLQVGRTDENGIHQWETVSFSGAWLDYYDEGQVSFTLYRWLDRGYVVYVENDRFEEKTVYPYTTDPLTKEIMYRRGYSAEEIARRWPRFANAVGITPNHDMDFREDSP